MSRSDPRVVLVTGAASGIGLAIAHRFLAAGDRVHISDVSPDALSTVLDDTPGLTGTLADSSDPNAVAALFADARAHHGPVDILVNNAGIGGPVGATEKLCIGDWRRTIDVNLNGAFYCIREALGPMKERRFGVVINISSSSARTGLPDRTPYVVAKQALMALTANVAREAGPYGVRCNSILPGVIHNARGLALIERQAEAQDVSFEEAQARFLRFCSMRTLIEPDDVAEAAHFLASPAGRAISGQHLGVCGNMEWEE